MWLNSDHAPHEWLQKLDINQAGGSLIVDKHLQTTVVKTNECLGLIIRKDELNNNLTAQITSWDCNQQKSFVCSLDDSKFTSPTQLTGFPCIPHNQDARKKRQEEEEGKGL